MRGSTETIVSVLIGSLTVALVVLIVILTAAGVYDIHTIIQEHTSERYAINLAQVLMSHPNLTYIKDGVIQRGILDKEKLDKIFIKKSECELNHCEIEQIINPTEKLDIGYPNSIATVRIVDLENNSLGWAGSLSGEFTVEGLSVSQAVSCLAENIKLETARDIIALFFRLEITPPQFRFLALWDPRDIEKCKARFLSSFGETTQGFPIAIRISDDEIHLGRLSITLVIY